MALMPRYAFLRRTLAIPDERHRLAKPNFVARLLEDGVFINDKKISEETVLLDGDEILIGRTTLLFTEKNFEDWESAMSHFKKVGERMRPTALDEPMPE